MNNHKTVHIIGAGLAGSEAAWQLAEQGIAVILHEMRPVKNTPAHTTNHMAELVCSNSFRSDDDEYNAVGQIHWEMRKMNSLIMAMAEKHKVPAGSALAIDRDAFSADITQTLENHPNITVSREEITELPPKEWEHVIIATGPLTSTPLAEAIKKATGETSLAFYDALAPIVFKESINFDIAWYQSRYDKGDSKDYINCPMTKEEYDAFYNALIASEKVEFKPWELTACGAEPDEKQKFFEGCMPIEVMAERGEQTLLFGPMKPVGLTNPNSDKKPYAVVQLRQDNALGTLYNIVGFQTKMKHGEQKSVFRMIPGLENAEFARLGGIHRNTFINSPVVLDDKLRLKAAPHIRFAGQITGCEGYVESSAIGLLAARMTLAELNGTEFTNPPAETSHGALLNHIITPENADTFQPMNVNFGLFPDVVVGKQRKIKGRDRKKLYTERAKEKFNEWFEKL